MKRIALAATIAAFPATAAQAALTIAGSKITFRDTGGPLACKGAQAVGTYTWKLQRAKLTLTKVRDTCGGRPLILSKRVFTRVS